MEVRASKVIKTRYNVLKVETPKLAVDCIVVKTDPKSGESGIVLIKRKYPPLGFALPGGFVDVGETTKAAAIREMKEELNIEVQIIKMLGVYDSPARDPRRHVVSIVYIGHTEQEPMAGDDAKEIFMWIPKEQKMPKMAFDHENILNDFFEKKYC